MELEELRKNRKTGEEDPALVAEIGKQKVLLETKYEALLEELKTHWTDWDSLIDRSQAGRAASVEELAKVTSKMVDVLNRRNYIRNLVRDVNAALEN